MPMLASDLMNPAFVGARNPDELMSVEFYWGTVKDFRGRPVLEKDGTARKVPYVAISIPGNETATHRTPVREEHKRRFPKQWQFWQMQEAEGAAGEITGWRLEDWDELNDEQRRDLKYQRFQVVEQLANASDHQVQRLAVDGMSLRLRARKALAQRADDERARERGERDREITLLRDQLAQVQAALNQLTGATKVAQATEASPPQPPKAAGKRTKEKAASP